MAKRSLPIDLTPELVEMLALEVARGNFRRVAAQRCGVATSTLYAWCSRGQKEIRDHLAGTRDALGLCGALVQAIEAAEGHVHGNIIQNILESDDLVSKRWFLEKRFAKQYTNGGLARDDETDETSKIEGAVVLTEKLRQLLEK